MFAAPMLPEPPLIACAVRSTLPDGLPQPGRREYTADLGHQVGLIVTLQRAQRLDHVPVDKVLALLREPAIQNGLQFLGLHGFGCVVVHARFAVSLHCAGGHRDDRRAPLSCSRRRISFVTAYPSISGICTSINTAW